MPTSSVSSPRPKRPVTRVTPAKVTINPVAQLTTLLANGATPEQLRPLLRESSGLQGLLGPLEIDLGRGLPDAPGELTRLQVSLRRRMAGDPAASRSAIRVHKDEAGWIAAAQRGICHFGWLFDPTLAVVIAATPAEQQRIQTLIARWWEDEFIPDGMDPAAAPSVVLAETIANRRWQEVFVAPDCLALPGAELASVVAAAALGLHTLRMPR